MTRHLGPTASTWASAALAVSPQVLAAAIAPPAERAWPPGAVPYVLTGAALELLDGRPPVARCACCCRPTALLVDDTGLCLDCDALWFPGLEA